MPTGYTAPVADGTITTLRDFALLCARNFGALVTMRDEPFTAPIPERLEPRPYYATKARQYRQRLSELERMSPGEAQRQCQQAHSLAMASWRRRTTDDARQRVRYQAMLQQVHDWLPPTPDHDGLDRFMREQLQQSEDFDCGHSEPVPRLQRWPEWLQHEMLSAAEMAAHYTTLHHEEVARVEQRNNWLQALRASLPE